MSKVICCWRRDVVYAFGWLGSRICCHCWRHFVQIICMDHELVQFLVRGVSILRQISISQRALWRSVFIAGQFCGFCLHELIFVHRELDGSFCHSFFFKISDAPFCNYFRLLWENWRFEFNLIWAWNWDDWNAFG